MRVRLLAAAALAASLLAGTAGPAEAGWGRHRWAQPSGEQDGWPVYRLTDARTHLPPVRPVSEPFRADVRLTLPGGVRQFYVHVPPGLTRPAPVVIGLHGLYQSASSQERRMGYMAVAQERGVIVVYPTARGGSWNAGRCCGDAAKQQWDDVSALQRIVREVAHAHPVDPRRRYAVGFSNGGMMAYKLACERPGYLAAMTVVAGAYVTGGAPDPCTPRTPVATLVVHSRQDSTVPYAGTAHSPFLGTSLPSVPQSAAVLRAVNDPARVPTVVVSLDGEAHVFPSTRTASGYDTRGRSLDLMLRHRSG